MNEKITPGRGPLIATLAAATAVATAALPAHAQQNSGTPAPANGPTSPNTGGRQGQSNGEPPSQTTGTPTGAAAQGESATQGGVPTARQNNGGGSRLPAPNGTQQQRTPGTNSRVGVATSSALTPIIGRAQNMLRTADARKIDAPGGAAQSYAKASAALRQMLSSAGYGSSASNSLPAPGSGRSSAAVSSFPLSSEQTTEDIRVLRTLAMQGQSGRSAAGKLSSAQLKQLASLYATGSKEFFTGQLREALLEPSSRVSLRLGNSRVEGERGGADNQAAGTGAARVRGDRPGLPFPVTLQRPAPAPVSAGEVTEEAEGLAVNPDGTPVTGMSVAGSAALPPGSATGEAGLPTLVPPGEVPSVVVPGPAAPIAPGVVGALPFGGAITPNIRFAPVPGYGGYFYGPPVLIQGIYPQQFTGNLYPGY